MKILVKLGCMNIISSGRSVYQILVDGNCEFIFSYGEICSPKLKKCGYNVSVRYLK